MSESTTMPVCSFCGSGVIPYPGMNISCGCNGTYEKMLYDALKFRLELRKVALTMTDKEIAEQMHKHPDTVRKTRVCQLKMWKYRSDHYVRRSIRPAA